MTSRHPNHEKIIDALIANRLTIKAIAKRYGSTPSAVKGMKARYIVEIRQRREDDPGEGQLNFFNQLRGGK